MVSFGANLPPPVQVPLLQWASTVTRPPSVRERALNQPDEWGPSNHFRRAIAVSWQGSVMTISSRH